MDLDNDVMIDEGKYKIWVVLIKKVSKGICTRHQVEQPGKGKNPS